VPIHSGPDVHKHERGDEQDDAYRPPTDYLPGYDEYQTTPAGNEYNESEQHTEVGGPTET
jgi:hypothetical protein